MLGYIVPDKPELKIKEYEMYSGYYCGICKSIGKRHGQIPRISLSYDSVFLALILAGIDQDKENLAIERCFVHPTKKRPILYNSKAVDYAADMHLLMMYHKLKDDLRDDHKPVAAAGVLLMKTLYGKLAARYPAKVKVIESQLEVLATLERENAPSFDRAAEPYAKIMEIIFRYDNRYFEGLDIETEDYLGKIGYNIGKWVYIIDAYDDLEENASKGSYNPLICQFNYNNDGDESIGMFKERITERVEFSLLYCLAEIAGTLANRTMNKNKELIENIVYLGLLRKTEQVLGKGRNEEHAESI